MFRRLHPGPQEEAIRAEIGRLIAAVAVSGGHRLFAADQDFDAIAKHVPLKLHKMRQAGRPR